MYGDMALNNCPHPALQLDETLQKILEFAASGEPWNESSNLRVVCKQWREMSFKGLCLSTSLPTIVQEDDEFLISDTEMTFETFRERFPKTCPAQIALSDPNIPFEMKIDQLPLPRDVAFIREFSSYIASVSAGNFGAFRDDEDNRIIENPIYDFKLPNLTRLYVGWDDEGNYEPWEQLVNHILDTSNRVGVVTYGYLCQDDSLYDPNTWPIVHPKVTHIIWTGMVTDLRRITIPVKQLIEIDVMFRNFKKPFDPIAESAALAEILERHSFTLQKVDTELRSFVKALKLSGGPLRELHTLETDGPILLSNDQSNPTSLPKLTTLRYRVGYHSEEESDGFKVSHLASGSLESLTWRMEQSITAAEEENREKIIVQKFNEEHFPVYPELWRLSIVNVPFSFGQAIFLKVVQCMENLTCLTVYFKEQPRTRSLLKDYTEDIFMTLTGMTRTEIPKDEALWSDSLKNKTNAITNLKNLIYLKIDTTTSSKCVLGRFIFHAAFHPMKKLEELTVGGSIEVDKKLIKEWKSAGRRFEVMKIMKRRRGRDKSSSSSSSSGGSCDSD